MRLIFAITFLVVFITSYSAHGFNHARKREAVATAVKQKFTDFRENCFPRGSGSGCLCTVTNTGGKDETINFATDDECRKPIEIKTAENKKELNAEFNGKFGGLRENCFPRPKGGCRCNEKDANGNEIEKKYESDLYCKLNSRVKRGNIIGREQNNQNVRDPIREKAQQNYAAVISELKDKFRGLREGCFPRPKGCLCVIGKNHEGRDITERRMKDADCKCRPNERSADCPAPGA